MDYEGKIYRPWIEADSVLIQTTLGCSHNKCTFCDMFREKRFKIKSLESIFADIEEARQIYRRARSFFLIDGNVMALKTDFLVQVLEKIKSTFPECEKISLYSGFNDMRRKTVEEMKALRAAGLDMAYVGLESGDPEILKDIEKGMTPEQAEAGMAKAKAAGIRVLASIIFGIGGKNRSRTHIVETTRLLNVLQPEELAPMALAIQPGTPLAQEIASGKFIQATPMQILEEEKYLLENMDFETFYWGDHGNNIVSLKGQFPEARERFLGKVNDAVAHDPITSQDILRTSSW